ncbi:O-antigen ligase [Rhizobium sp. BK661]|uniref:O-antigen ligase family protein n=1 Tax=Rhizobium sp. BK661 TaxID=2586991 RepID=UPI0021694A8A|nr:O-antigen ligase family protein [Rhizobium sp. BK661]MCS3742972.1 O-antigen ligase [Rhizobium sp. BK661]
MISNNQRPRSRLTTLRTTAIDQSALHPVNRVATTRKSTSAKADQTRLGWPVKVFLVGLLIPWVLPIGPLNLSVYRIILLIALVPCIIKWSQGKAGKKRVADFGLMAFCLWAAISFVVVQGIDKSIEPSGSLFMETIGSYYLARVCIRNADDFRNMVVFVAKLIIGLLPFTVYEWVTGTNLLLLAFGTVFRTEAITWMAPRMGFSRVQGPFNHSILFGTFCGSMLALTCLTTNGKVSGISRAVLTGLVGFSAFLSMSSAPLAGVVVQIALMLWNKVLGGFTARWKLLWAVAFVGYLIVELGSNQTPAQFYISHFTFDQQTGWYRLWIWEYGSASVANHPIFGIGLGDWARPLWMPGDSVDNFWLLMAMRHGLPGFLFMVLSLLSIWLSVARKTDIDPDNDLCRTSYLICMVAFVFVGSTVHFWVAAYAWFFFLVGSGVWILDCHRQRQELPNQCPQAAGRLSTCGEPRIGNEAVVRRGPLFDLAPNNGLPRCRSRGGGYH